MDSTLIIAEFGAFDDDDFDELSLLVVYKPPDHSFTVLLVEPEYKFPVIQYEFYNHKALLRAVFPNGMRLTQENLDNLIKYFTEEDDHEV